MKNKKVKTLILGLTGRCNFACAYCYASNQPSEDMPLVVAVRAIELAAANGAFVLQFSGGEPLLAFERLRQIAEYVRDRGLPAVMQVQTNGSLITREIAGFFREAAIGVGVSLDGRPAENDRLRRLPSGEGSSGHILRGAAVLAEAGVEIGLTCVVAPENVRKLAGIVEMAAYLGNVRKIGFDLLRPQGQGAGMTSPDAGEVEAGMKQALLARQRLFEQTGRKISFAHEERVESLACQKIEMFSHCHALSGEALFVAPDGDYYACASLAGYPQFRLGNVRDGLDEARQEAAGQEIRQRMERCFACPSLPLCGGGCFARWYASGADDGCCAPECALKQVFIDEYVR